MSKFFLSEGYRVLYDNNDFLFVKPEIKIKNSYIKITSSSIETKRSKH